MDQVLNCPSCHHADVDFSRLSPGRVRCGICRALIEVDKHKLFAAVPNGGVAELTGTVIDRKALFSDRAGAHQTGGDLVNSFPVDFYVSDEGYICVQNGNEVATLSPPQASELAAWLPKAVELANGRYKPEPLE
jgi:hypothetical protein